MKIELTVLRTDRVTKKSREQRILYVMDGNNASAALLLKRINAEKELRDMDGGLVKPVAWECSCLQKRCGACAMRINGYPGLACGTRLEELPGGKLRLEPLRKFPVIEDLIVDRSILYENLKTIHAWMTADGVLDERHYAAAYEGSRCLQCGCCLEVCPNFYPGGKFLGMAAFAPTARLISALPAEAQKELRTLYRKHIYEGCGKSLACRTVCPAGIDADHLLVNSNAMAVWKRR